MTKERVLLSILTLILILASVPLAKWMLRRSPQNNSSVDGAIAEVRTISFQPTVPNPVSLERRMAPPGMAWIPGGEFSMGAEDPRDLPSGGNEAMADARPIHRVYVNGFWMDKTDVTNRQFAEFVAATGYLTVAERKPRA